MTTTLQLITRTERWLYSQSLPERNKLSAQMAANATSLTLTYPAGGITEGAVICIDLEEFLVWGVSDLTVTVESIGGTPAIHAAGAHIFVKPRFSRLSILDALIAANDELSAFGMFQVLTVDKTYDSSIQGYDFGDLPVLEVYDVMWKETGSRKDWSPVARWRFEPKMLVSDFASGNALFIEGAGDGQPVRARYFAPFTALATLTDDVLAVSGLPATGHDIPPYLAAANLVGPTEVSRNDPKVATDSRRSEEVPVGAQQRSAAWLRAQGEMRARQEADRIRGLYPRRRR